MVAPFLVAALVLTGCADQLPVGESRAEVVESGDLPDAMLNVEGGIDLAVLDDVGSFDASVANAYFELSYNTTKTELLTPPVASRNFGYTGVALYEALVGGMPGYQSMVGQLNEFDSAPSIDPALEYHWPTVANSALGRIMWGLYKDRPAALASIRALHDEYAKEFRSVLSQETYQRSALHGRAV
ncbi:MAG: hypothetical protein OEV30_08320, partial [Ignavibacteria bacterium]|nr:hypothetical protein [Ignavibacteria bacterium]